MKTKSKSIWVCLVLALCVSTQSDPIDRKKIEAVKAKLIKHKIKCVDIVINQVRLETANLTAPTYTVHKNLFGFKRKGKVMHFQKEEESIERYKKYIQVHYKGKRSYYDFLKCMYTWDDDGRCQPYCPDENYIKLLKQF